MVADTDVDSLAVAVLIISAISRSPVSYSQAGYPLELALIIGNERDVHGSGMSRNPQVIVPDDLPLRFQGGAKFTVRISPIFGHGHHWNQLDEFGKLLQSPGPLLTLLCAIK